MLNFCCGSRTEKLRKFVRVSTCWDGHGIDGEEASQLGGSEQHVEDVNGWASRSFALMVAMWMLWWLVRGLAF